MYQNIKLAPTEGKEEGVWEVLVPEDAFISGQNLVEAFVIRRGRGDLLLSRIYSSMDQIPSRNNLVLEVARWYWGVDSAGLYPQEWWGDRPARWTDGAASLVIPIDQARPPKGLELSLLHTGPQGAALEILVNGCQLFEQELPPGEESLTMGLSPCALDGDRLKIDLISSTFVPAKVNPKSTDQRHLGVAIESLTLLD